MNTTQIIKRILLLALCFTMVFAAISCSGTGKTNDGSLPDDYTATIKGTIKLTDSLSGGNKAYALAMDAYVDYFEQKYPDTKIIKDYISNAGMIDTLISSGDIGDVFWMAETDVYKHAVTNKALMPLDSYTQALDIDLSNVFTGILNLGMVEGQLYMASRDYNHMVMIYNSDAIIGAGLTKPENGMSWNEFKDICKRVTQKDSTQTSFSQVGALMMLDYSPIYTAIMSGYGGQYVDTVNKKVHLYSDENVLKAIKDVLEFANNGYIKAQGVTYNSGMAMPAESDVAGYVFQSCAYPTALVVAEQFEAQGINWDLVTFPQFPTAAVGTGSSGFGVYNKTNNPDTAAAFVLNMFTEDGQKTYHGQETGGSVPLLQSLADDPFWHSVTDSTGNANWEDKNWNAFVAYPEYDIVGQVNCVVPTDIGKIIDDCWKDMVSAYFNGGNWESVLETAETEANQRWAVIMQSVKQG